MTLNTTGVTNTITTILGLIGRLEPAVAALPAVAGLIEAAISVFSSEDKATVQAAYQAKIAQTDTDHKATQKVLSEEAGKVPGAASTDASAKGGAV